MTLNFLNKNFKEISNIIQKYQILNEKKYYIRCMYRKVNYNKFTYQRIPLSYFEILNDL